MTARDKILKALEDEALTSFELANKAKLWSGTMYPALVELEAEEIVESFWSESVLGKPRHRYYRLKEQSNGNHTNTKTHN